MQVWQNVAGRTTNENANQQETEGRNWSNNNTYSLIIAPWLFCYFFPGLLLISNNEKCFIAIIADYSHIHNDHSYLHCFNNDTPTIIIINDQ